MKNWKEKYVNSNKRVIASWVNSRELSDKCADWINDLQYKDYDHLEETYKDIKNHVTMIIISLEKKITSQVEELFEKVNTLFFYYNCHSPL
jgi:hypothetical protein